jgi:hypothetical protein
MVGIRYTFVMLVGSGVRHVTGIAGAEAPWCRAGSPPRHTEGLFAAACIVDAQAATMKEDKR